MKYNCFFTKQSIPDRFRFPLFLIDPALPQISLLSLCGWQLGAGSYGLSAPPAYGFIHEEECPVGIDENFATIVTGLVVGLAAAAVLAAVAVRFPPGGKKKRDFGLGFGGVLGFGHLDGLALSVSKSKSRARVQISESNPRLLRYNLDR